MTRSKARLAELKDKDVICKEGQEKCLGEEDIIECDTCRQWFHRKCLDKTYTKKEWEFMTGDNQNIMFKCVACIHDRGEKINEIKEIKEMLHQSLRDNHHHHLPFILGQDIGHLPEPSSYPYPVPPYLIPPIPLLAAFCPSQLLSAMSLLVFSCLSLPGGSTALLLQGCKALASSACGRSIAISSS